MENIITTRCGGLINLDWPFLPPAWCPARANDFDLHKSDRGRLSGDGQASHLGQVHVVSEENHLCLSSQVPEHLEASRGTGVVEIDEQIVNDERKRGRRVQVLLKRCNPQRQEQLIGRACAEPLHGHGLVILPYR